MPAASALTSSTSSTASSERSRRRMGLRPRNPWCAEPNRYDFLAPDRCSPCFSRPGCSRKSADAPTVPTVCRSGTLASISERNVEDQGAQMSTSPRRTTRAPPRGARAARADSVAPSRRRDRDARRRARRARRARCGARGGLGVTGGNVPGPPRCSPRALRWRPAARPGAGAAPPGRRPTDEPVTFTVAFAQRGRLVQPVPRDRGGVLRDVGADLRLPRRLLMEDMSPEPGAGHRVGDLRRRPDLDLHDPRRRDLVRRRAADRPGRRLHLRPDPRRRPGGGDLVVVPQRRRVGRRARRHHRRARP